MRGMKPYGPSALQTALVSKVRRAVDASQIPWHLQEKVSEPPRTRTWNLEIKSLCRGGSARFRGLQIWLGYAESYDTVFRGVSDCSVRLVSN
jgi:hypothetical protein